MTRKILIVAAIILLLAGIGFLLFPPISNWIGKMNNDKLSHQFDDTRDNVVDYVEDSDGSRADNAKDAKDKGLVDKDGYRIDSDGSRLSDFPFVFRNDLAQIREDNPLPFTTSSSSMTTATAHRVLPSCSNTTSTPFTATALPITKT